MAGEEQRGVPKIICAVTTCSGHRKEVNMLQKIRYRYEVLRMLSPMAVGIRKLFVIDLVCTVIVLGLSLIQPFFYSIFIEKVILGRKLNLLLVVVAGYCILQWMDTGLAFLKNYCHYRLNNQVTVKMKEIILSNALRRDITGYRHMEPGKEKMVMDDAVVKMCDFTSNQTSDYVVNYGKMLILLVMLFVMEWRLALVLVIALPVSFILNHRNGQKAKKNNDERWENERAWNEWNYATVKAWREVRAMNLESVCENRFLALAKEYRRLFFIFTDHWVTRRLVIPKIKDEFLMQFLLYFIGGILIFRGSITIGVLLVFAQYYSMLTEAVQSVVSADTDLQVNRTHYDKALEAISEQMPDDSDKITEIRNCNLSFQNVSFRYEDGEREVLTRFSMDIHQGERVGIVGESGKGKTTLLNLIVGILKPTTGQIFFGGESLEKLNLKALHRKVGFVLQENMLFNTSIYENLLYGNENASEEEMKRACQKAYIWDFICELPEGLETIIGEKGIKLSGGQKQRLVLARLFLRDVDMFIFDEATSSLDQHGEQMIQKAIREISEDKTIIVVAHRQSSLELCRRLIYL